MTTRYVMALTNERFVLAVIFMRPSPVDEGGQQWIVKNAKALRMIG